jgi:hypothetical protein
VHLSFCDVEVDVVERDDVAEGFADPASPDCAGMTHVVP